MRMRSSVAAIGGRAAVGAAMSGLADGGGRICRHQALNGRICGHWPRDVWWRKVDGSNQIRLCWPRGSRFRHHRAHYEQIRGWRPRMARSTGADGKESNVFFVFFFGFPF